MIGEKDRQLNGMLLNEDDISDIDKLVMQLRKIPDSLSEKGAYMTIGFMHGLEAAEASEGRLRA